MSINLRRIVNRIDKKFKFVFDLDETIWQHTVEKSPDLSKEYVETTIHKDVYPILETLQDEGFSLNIASRSYTPERCNHYLSHLFPNIEFDKKEIFFTAHYKNFHINNIYGLSDERKYFIMFDDEKNILDHLRKLHPFSYLIHCPHSINEKTFEKLERKMEERPI